MKDKTLNPPKKKFRSAAAFVISVIILLAPALLQSQERDDFLRPFFGYYDSQSLTTSIGNATVASGQIIPGRSSNPANLGLNRFSHLQMNFQNSNFQGQGVGSSSTELGGVYAVMPVRVYRGSLVFGAGIQKAIDFSNAFQTSGRQFAEEGGIYATEFGVSVEAAENLFIGGAFNYLKGSDDLTNTASVDNSHLKAKYNGYNFSLGFLSRTTANVQIGASVQFPTHIGVQDKVITWQTGAPTESVSQTWNYDLKRPMVFHTGFSLLYPLYSIFYEMEWTDWQDMEFSSDEYYDGDVAEINLEIKHDFRSTLTHHLGTAVHLPWLPLHLYGGYQYMPVPFKDVYDGDKRQSLSLGSSYLLNQQFSIHGSFSHYFWKYSGQAEKYSMLVFGVSFHS
ncbi:hypothetical protein K9N50_07355 [bacterium]|nr:hypothetical protein [bacterium]